MNLKIQNCLIKNTYISVQVKHHASLKSIYQHTNEEDSSLHYPGHRNLHDILLRCDSKTPSVHIEQQHELAAT